MSKVENKGRKLGEARFRDKIGKVERDKASGNRFRDSMSRVERQTDGRGIGLLLNFATT
jgi:hypothetical protein